MSKQYNIFISHSWNYNEHYEKIVNMLKSQGIDFKDYSVPKDDPLHTNGTDKDLYDAIKRKISPCSVVVIMAGVYSSYSKWIDKEIKIAKEEFLFEKKILAVEPWGSEKTSKKVKDNADEIVKWQAKSIADAIKRLG
ncbi:TIR domain-containing protein [Clostridioides difficile]|nr:TIR domain-containing protein [Clostridioides difficile]